MPPADWGDGPAPEEIHGHFAAIVEFSDDAILSKDRNGVILSWNPAAERMYGYTAEEAVGQPISILIPDHRVGEEHMILDRVLRGDRVDHYETDRITKDGRIITVSLTVSPIRDADGSVNAASVIARDITRRHRTLLLAAKLQEVTSELSREVAGQRVIDLVLRDVTLALRAGAGAVGLVDNGEIELAGSTGYSKAGLAPWERFPVAADVPMAHAVRTGEAVWATTPEALEERFPAVREASVPLASIAVLPLASAGSTFGALAISFERPRELDPEERAFLVAATQQAAYALERARMFEAERLVAERQTLLAEAGELLAASLDPEAALARLASLAVRHVADWCGVELVGDDGSLRSVAVAHADESRTALARELRRRYPVDPRAETGVGGG
jgi:PAS domain S-box-containing protein